MNEFVELKSKINNIFDDLMARLQQTPEGGAPETSGDWIPRVDLYELPERFLLRADIPGISPEDLDVRLDGGHLILRGERPQPADLDPAALCRLERPFGKFHRRYALPDGIDPELVRASYRDGILEIIVGKRESTSTRRIPVKPD